MNGVTDTLIARGASISPRHELSEPTRSITAAEDPAASERGTPLAFGALENRQGELEGNPSLETSRLAGTAADFWPKLHRKPILYPLEIQWLTTNNNPSLPLIIVGAAPESGSF